jgi:hypothetical protein
MPSALLSATYFVQASPSSACRRGRQERAPAARERRPPASRPSPAGSRSPPPAQSIRLPDLAAGRRAWAAPRAGEPCDACGRILSIREISTTRGPPPATLSPVPGGGGDPTNPNQQNLIGAVIYLPLGGQSADKPYIGGVGTPEMYARMRETTYEVTVRLDDGPSASGAPRGRDIRVGDRVRWVGSDELELLVN